MSQPADLAPGKARIIAKWRRRHARLQQEFEAAQIAAPGTAEIIRTEMAALALAIRRYAEDRQGPRRRQK